MKRHFIARTFSIAALIFAVVIFGAPLSAQAHLDLGDLDTYLMAPENRAELNRQVSEMRRLLRNPPSTTFLLKEPGVKYQSKLQELFECVESQCRMYERKFLYKVVSLKTDIRRGRIHAINVHLVELSVTSLKVWDADAAGNKKGLVQDETSISSFRFL